MEGMETEELVTAREIELPRSPDAPAVARRFLDAQLQARLGEVAYTNARLIVSELVTNAFLHGVGRIFLSIEQRADVVRIEVVDEGSGEAPAIREQPDGVAGGWGLRIVDTVALRWGAAEGTTHVWAEIGLD